MSFKVTETKHLRTHRYESLGAFADYQLANQKYKMARRDAASNRAFSGVASIEEAVEKCKRGLPESGLKVLKTSQSLTASAIKQATALNVQNTFDVSGAFVDMGRFVEGEPECMVESVFNTAPVVQPVVTIVSNVNASGGISKSDLEARGRLVVALIKAIETSGRSTELLVDHINKGRFGMRSKREHYYRNVVMIKRASSPLDMGAVMYAFSDPSMLRVLCFNAMHALPEDLQGAYGVGSGYGCVPEGRIKVEETFGENVVYLPAVRWGSEDNAERTVTKVLEDLGIA